VGIGMRGPAFGDYDDRAEIHRMAPEFCEDLALKFDVLDPFGVFRGLYGRDNF